MSKTVNISEMVVAVNKVIGNRCGAKLTVLEGGTIRRIPVIPTGIPSLDAALGVGGIPGGRITEIYGPESSGKTTLALRILAQAQGLDAPCGYIDAEHALDPAWAAVQMVDCKNLALVQPDSGEEALKTLEYMIDCGFRYLVVDSVAALVPQAELDGEMGDAHVALQARMMSQAMRKITGKVARTKATVVFINQIRNTIGGFGFGNNDTTTGGKALKFYASIRIDIRRIGSEKEKEIPVGNVVKIKIVKNKVAPPFKVCEAVIDFRTGFNKHVNLFNAMLRDKYRLRKVAKSYKWDKEVISANGKPDALAWFKDIDDATLDLIYAEYVEKITGHKPVLLDLSKVTDKGENRKKARKAKEAKEAKEAVEKEESGDEE